MAKTRVRPFAIVFDSPPLDFATRIVERDEDLLVQSLLAQPAVEALDEGVLDRFSRLDELQLNAALVGPLIEYAAGKFRPVVALNHCRQSAPATQPFQYSLHPLAGEREVDLDGQTLPTPFIDHRQRAKASSIEQPVVNEVERPRLICGRRRLPHHAQMAQAFASSAPSQRQPFCPVQPLDPLVVNPPAFTSDELVEQRTAPASPLF